MMMMISFAAGITRRRRPPHLNCLFKYHDASLGVLFRGQYSERYYHSQQQQQHSFNILGIETSCDDTGVAIVNQNGQVIAERLTTHFDIVKQYGGVYPDEVAKHHEMAINELVKQVMREAQQDVPFNGIDAVAVTCGPGLNPCLKVGVQTAKRLCTEWQKPVIAVNHLEAHLLSPRMFSPDISFPYLTLLVSGGHCLLVLAKSLGDYQILVTTTDDSVGEAFDKVARLLDIDYGENEFKSAGSALEHRARQYNLLPTDVQNKYKVHFAVPLRNRRKKDAEYSFSGLKANVLRQVRILELQQLQQQERESSEPNSNTSTSLDISLNEFMAKNRNLKGNAAQLSEEQKLCIIHEFQNVAFTHLLEKTELAFNTFNCLSGVKDFVICGGVAANQVLRSRLQHLCDNYKLTLHTPPVKYCTDNGVMVAWAGAERYKHSESLLKEPIDSIDLRGRWPLSTLSSTRNFVKEEKSTHRTTPEQH